MQIYVQPFINYQKILERQQERASYVLMKNSQKEKRKQSRKSNEKCLVKNRT